MKHFYLLLILASLLFSSCDWRKDPKIEGYASVKLNEKNEYVCSINGETFSVDSVLFTNGTEKIYIKPEDGQRVTYFTIGDHKGFYDGFAKEDEIKNTYFIGDILNGSLNFCIFMMVVMFLYGYVSICKEKKEDEEDAKSQQNN